MSGNRLGGLKAKEKLLASDPDYYKKIGGIGGKRSRNGGFGSRKLGVDGMTGWERARIAGKKGGKKSKRS